MSSSGIIIALRCMDCLRQVNPREVVRIGESVVQCWDCYVKQTKVLDGWKPPRECALCHVSFNDLCFRTIGESVPMYPHWIDGVFVMLCAPCDKKHVLAAREQFRDTRYGWELGLK